ncbi:MFS transporter [Paractinoplanes toevensis]|uniref:MFS transporter n=1 Tax=Paractinoplanes toevensis TaxID=571911 RepID=A0A919TB70_9ACTN|nr:MFS transporter [Actinoplanes toevensis]GIM91827.1 MFS transporter [Actinoplanes toevensis]
MSDATAGSKTGGLWRHGNFMRLWTGQAVSDFGGEITQLALPLTAIFVLNAPVWQVGLLRAATAAPLLLFSIPAGMLADRLRRRPILIVSDLARAVVLAVVPLAAVLHVLSIGLLVVVGLVAGTFNVLFLVTYQAFLPTVVTPDALVEGNSKLQTTGAIAEVAAPSAGGALIQWLTAPIVVLLDALSFLFSAFMISRVRVEETVVAAPRRALLADLLVGWRHLVAHPLLRAIAVGSTIMGIFFGVQQTVLILFMTRTLHYSALAIGLILAVGSVGAIVGAVASGRVGRNALGPTLIAATLLNAIGGTLLGTTTGALAVPVLVLGQFLVGASFPMYFVQQTSLRQAVSPPEYLGRITAAFAMITWGMIPIGALIGGLLPSFLGLQATLLLGGLGKLLAVAWLWFSPVRQVRSIET